MVQASGPVLCTDDPLGNGGHHGIRRKTGGARRFRRPRIGWPRRAGVGAVALDDLVRQSSFIFQGVIVKAGATSTSEVPVSPSTAVVKAQVRRVMRSPGLRRRSCIPKEGLTEGWPDSRPTYRYATSCTHCREILERTRCARPSPCTFGGQIGLR